MCMYGDTLVNDMYNIVLFRSPISLVVPLWSKGGISCDGRTVLHFFYCGSMNGLMYIDDVFLN